MKLSRVIVAVCPILLVSTPVKFVYSSGIDAHFEFDRDRLYDCYNYGEIVFFRDGRVTYNGDDFAVLEPTRWLKEGGSVEADTVIGLEFNRIHIEESKASAIALYDGKGQKVVYDQTSLPKVNDSFPISISNGPVAFTLQFQHDTAMLDVSFDLYDPLNKDNRSELSYGLNCIK